ncbi:hypothetical protein [Methanosarcina sp. UBA5]|uniref:hypothetical protein n=1 Tax=Methanosarcina sp. UBA5 TaxID=1915593 RepID=UPI0025F42004|nr:hypothetical protein [Methanosarcina sp. UBA5]
MEDSKRIYKRFKEKYQAAEGVFEGYVENGKYVFEIRRKYPTAKGLLEDRLMTCSLGKQMHKSVNEGFEIIENAGICRLEDTDFKIFLRKWM